MAQIDVAIIGGGAAGYFSAITASNHANGKIVIYEKSNKVLQKVKVSGGGRCNVTHACFEQKELVKNYPRGEKELLGPFHTFMTFDTITWFEEHGVQLKTEEDGRMFPVTDSSQTIIDCFEREIKKYGIQVELNKGLVDLNPDRDGILLAFSDGLVVKANKVIVCTGSNERMWELLRKKNIDVVDPVPSLFTFNYKNKLFNGLMGLSLPNAHIKICGTGFEAYGPLLFTHWGFSGPAILRLSAWAAKELAEKNYMFEIEIDFTGIQDPEQITHDFMVLRTHNASKTCKNVRLPYIPSRLWEALCIDAHISEKRLADLTRDEINSFIKKLAAFRAQINGKSTFKEEFVTCGGVDLKEVNMKTMECKKIPGLYFAGECLNIDAVTGGFNFQAAWTTGFIAGQGG
ncbi:MAG TPA: NAD(P)/FAD-dependent oxidoreductase [Flavobacteriales bacterium]|nr:NAD(P)/FAD-dependent oxidoreductase [Flavobacteriales bacterium]